MTPSDMSATLARYGASLDADNAIVSPSGRFTHVKLAVIRGRLVATSERGARLYSGAPVAASVARFVESFWYWTARDVGAAP